MGSDVMHKGRRAHDKGSHAVDELDDKTGFKSWLPRVGYAAKGTVYILVGVLAVMAAVGGGASGQTGGSKDALAWISQQPFGDFLLGVVGLGLLFYAIWQFVRAIWDPEGMGSDAKGIGKRVFHFVVGVIYGSLGVWAMSAVLGSGSASTGGGQQRSETLTAQVMSWPAGPWIVGLIGLVIIGYGLFEFYRSYTAKFTEKLNGYEMSPEERHWSKRIGQIGMACRGVVFLLVGGFFIDAALSSSPQEAGGLEQALNTIAAQPFGQIALIVIALGLAAYGVFQWVKARYRRVDWGSNPYHGPAFK